MFKKRCSLFVCFLGCGAFVTSAQSQMVPAQNDAAARARSATPAAAASELPAAEASPRMKSLMEKVGQAVKADNTAEVTRLMNAVVAQAQAEKSVAMEIFALQLLGVYLESKGKYAEALTRYEARLKLTRAHPYGEDVALTEAGALFQIGVVRRLMGNESGARQAYEEARLLPGLRNNPAKNYVPEMFLSSIGDVYEQSGRHADAIAAYQDALVYARAADNDHTWEPQLLARIANARTSVAARPKWSPELALQSGHNAPVLTCALSPDGAMAASGDLEGGLKVWNTRTGELLRTLNGHTGVITKVVFARDSSLLSASGDGTLKLWNPRTGALLHTFLQTVGATSAAFSPDGQMVAGGTISGEVKVWSRAGAALPAPKSLGVGVVAVAFSPDGRSLAVVGADQNNGAVIGQGLVSDVATGETRFTLSGHAATINSVAWSPDGNLLGTNAMDGTARLWDARTGKLVRTLSGNAEALGQASFSPDGQTLAVTATGNIAGGELQSDQIKLWDVRTGKLRRAFSTKSHYPVSIAWSSDGRTLVSGGLDKTVKVWDVASGSLTRMLPAYTQLVARVAFLPDGSLTSGELRSGLRGARAEYKLWDMQSGELKRVLARYSAPDIASVNGDFSVATGVLAAMRGENTLEVTDTRNNRLLWKAKAHAAKITYIILSPDARTVATAGADKIVKLWSVATGKLLHTLSGVQAPLDTMIFSRDGRSLAGGSTFDGDDKTVKVWNVASGKLVQSLKGNEKGVYALAWSPDNRSLSSAGDDATVRIWDVASGKLKHTLDHKATLFGLERSIGVLSVAWSPNGSMLATGTNDGTIRMWNTASGTLQRALSGRGATALSFSLAFSPDNRRLACGAYDGAIHLWDVASGKPVVTLLSLPPSGRFSGLASDAAAANAEPASVEEREGLVTDLSEVDDYLVSTEEGYYTGSAAADRYVRFRLGDDLFPAESFQSRYYRPDLVRAVLAGKAVPSVGEFKGAFPPLAGFAPMPGGNKLSGASATITLQATDDSVVKRVELFVNGTRVDAKALEIGSKAFEIGSKALEIGSKDIGDRPIPAAHKSLKNFTATIPLPAQGTSIKVQAIAYDDDGLQSPRAEMLFTRDPQARASGKLLGLCVGVSQYQDARLNLKYADSDASSLSQTLNRQRGLYSDARTRTLTNQEATRDNVKKALDSLIAQTTRADTVWVMLSGHGWRSDERSFYFATHEVDRHNVAATALPWTAVVSRLQKLSEKSKRVIVLLDACHSGSAATNEELVKATLSANAGVLIFASSKGSEVSLELGELQHGAFTQALTEGIEGKAAPAGEQSVTTLDLLSYVARRVKNLTGDTQHPQVPFLQDFDTDAPIVARLTQ